MGWRVSAENQIFEFFLNLNFFLNFQERERERERDFQFLIKCVNFMRERDE